MVKAMRFVAVGLVAVLAACAASPSHERTRSAVSLQERRDVALFRWQVEQIKDACSRKDQRWLSWGITADSWDDRIAARAMLPIALDSTLLSDAQNLRGAVMNAKETYNDYYKQTIDKETAKMVLTGGTFCFWTAPVDSELGLWLKEN